MPLAPTLILLAVGVIAFGLANYRSRQPRAPGNPPLIPFGAIQFVALVVVVLMLAHLVTLLTGQPLTGRAPP